MTAPRPETHNDYQREYYAPADRSRRVRSRMAPADTPYVRRHLERTLAALGWGISGSSASFGRSGSSDNGALRLVEVGAGLGRFSLPLAARGHEVTAVDLSPDLVARLRQHAAGVETGSSLGSQGSQGSPGSLRAIEGDATALPDLSELAAGRPFDAVVGFFFLHHLTSVAAMARAAAAVLRPGGRVAFCEPNAFHPGFYLQIALTPGMTWRGDRGVARMRPGVLRPAFEGAGFRDVTIERYGLFPPALANRPWGAAVEARLERLMPLRPLRAFQVVSGRLDG